MSSKSKSAALNGASMAALVPKLRFPEFRGAAGWMPKPMGEAYSFKGNNSLSRDKLNYVAGSVRNIHYGDIHTKFSTHFDITKELVPFINDVEAGTVRSENLCAEGDMIFADASEDLADIGKGIEIARLNGERVASGLHTILARRNGELIALGFGGHLFKSEWVRTQIQKEAQGAKVLGISPTRLRNLHLPLPHDKAEQQKISDCLGLVDDLLAAQARKVDTLKTRKIGLMQQLFPRNGETQPRLRFPEFKNSGEWKTRKVSSLLTRVVSPVRVEGDKVYREIGIRSHGKGIFHKAPLLGKALGDKRVFRVEERAFVLNIVFAWEQAVAVTSMAEKEMIASHRFPMYKPIARESDIDFIKYYFLTNRGKELLGIASPGGAGRNKTLGQKEFERSELLCPGNVEEQTAIAHSLSSADDLITAETQKLEALKTHKKGLMQQLFPSPEKVEA